MTQEARVTDIYSYLLKRSNNGLLPWEVHVAAADHFAIDCGEVEEVALENNLLPSRYQRNQNMLSTQQQLQLFRSTVAVIGCGGLGGYILEELARLGVGTLIAIDPDCFEEHNLNRQLLSSPALLNSPKVAAAAQRIEEINSSVTVHTQQAKFSAKNAEELLATVDVVADAVDNVPTRFELADACNKLNIPFVHGAIAGWYGQVTTIYPGEDTLQKIYRNWVEGKGGEAQLGNPSFTPAVVASIEVAEICKVLLNQGNLLRNRKLSINLLDMEMEEIRL